MNTGIQEHIPAHSATPKSSSAPALQSSEIKSPTAFRTISEVAEDLRLPQHVLRFWESKFQQIRPLKRGGGRRYYRPEDVQMIHDIKDLLYNQGFTIRGVQKLLREKNQATSYARSMVPQPQLPVTVPVQSKEQPAAHAPATAQPQHQTTPIQRREIENVLAELKAMRKLLQQTGI
ncbi:MAG: MerR family transcriptional regulator [Alphaproteobacteria bacterium]|nr:MerR family transcriptional regulator [Alphaproteobacteria bacterium]